jgi:MFS family permease
VTVSPVQIASDRRIFYGWIVVFTLAITETVSWGVLYYSFSAVLALMREDLGWSTATISGAYSLGLLVSGLAAPLVGRVIDRSGPRVVMTLGSVLGVLTTVAWAKADSVVVFYLIWAFAGLAMSATLYEPAFASATRWFDRHRGRAVLVITLFAGFASTIFLPLTAWFAQMWGWRSALLALSAILAVMTVLPHALILRSHPERFGLHPDGEAPRANVPGTKSDTVVTLREALHDRAFWWLAIAFSLETFSMIAVGVHLIPYLTDRGDGATFAAAVTGFIGAAQVGARVLATIFGGRMSEVHLTALVFGLQAVAITVLLQWQSTAGVLVAVILLGAGRGVVTLMRASLVASLYGRSHFGSINGTLALFLTGARSIAPVAAGIAYVVLGDYVPVLWAMALISLLAAITVLPVSRRLPAVR